MGINLWRNQMLRQSAKYRDRQIVHKTTRTDNDSWTLQTAEFSQFKVNKKTPQNNKFLKY